jgi:magnesium-transporting ATPase (P-type)
MIYAVSACTPAIPSQTLKRAFATSVECSVGIEIASTHFVQSSPTVRMYLLLYFLMVQLVQQMMSWVLHRNFEDLTPLFNNHFSVCSLATITGVTLYIIYLCIINNLFVHAMEFCVIQLYNNEPFVNHTRSLTSFVTPGHMNLSVILLVVFFPYNHRHGMLSKYFHLLVFI